MLIRKRKQLDPSTDQNSGGNHTPDPAVIAQQKVEKLEGTVNEMVDILTTLAKTSPEENKQEVKPHVDAKLDAKDKNGSPLFNDEQREYIRKEFKTVMTEENQSARRQRLTVEFDSAAEDKFPELKDKTSVLWKRTQAVIADLKAVDPHAQTRPDLIWSAAHTAEEQLLKERVNKNNIHREGRRSGFLSSKSYLESGGGSASSRSRQNHSNQNSNDNDDVSETRLAVRGLLGVKPKK